MFSDYPGEKVIGAGTNADAGTPLSGDLIEWADIVLVMEKSHRNKVAKKFRDQLKAKRLVVLDITDEFEYMHPSWLSC